MYIYRNECIDESHREFQPAFHIVMGGCFSNEQHLYVLDNDTLEWQRYKAKQHHRELQHEHSMNRENRPKALSTTCEAEEIV